MRSVFVHNGDVAIHVLESGTPSPQTSSLLVIEGLWEPAERAIPILSALSGHVIAFSFRGRGLSSTPETGYGLEGHLSDIGAVVNHFGLNNYCVLGFSRGASYALGWSLAHQQDMRGLILVDQPPVHVKPGPGYVDYWAGLVYLGVPILNFMRRSALEGLQREAEQIDFSARLQELRIPVTFFAGRNCDAVIPSNVDDDIIEQYRKAIPSITVVNFLKSGHMIPDEEPEKYIMEIEAFLQRLKAGKE